MTRATNTATTGHPQAIIRQLKSVYQQFNAPSLAKLNELYTQDVEFIDPVHRLTTLSALKQYFDHASHNLARCEFEFIDEQIGENQVYLSWRMTFTHKRINRGNSVTVEGVSHLRYTHKIYFHQDYYDLSVMVYDHLPILGRISQWIKKTMAGRK